MGKKIFLAVGIVLSLCSIVFVVLFLSSGQAVKNFYDRNGTASPLFDAQVSMAYFPFQKCLNSSQCVSRFFSTALYQFLDTTGKSNTAVYECTNGIITFYTVNLTDFDAKYITCKPLSVEKKEETASDQKGLYRDEDFGIAFKLNALAKEVKKDGNFLTSPEQGGFIQRLDLKDGENLQSSIVRLIGDENGDTDFCRIELMPWMPNNDSGLQKGQIAASISLAEAYKPSNKEVQLYINDNLPSFTTFNHPVSIADVKKCFTDGDNLECAWAEESVISARAEKLCSHYASLSELNVGSFVYDPIAAPDRYYFVKTETKAGARNFYERGSMHILNSAIK